MSQFCSEACYQMANASEAIRTASTTARHVFKWTATKCHGCTVNGCCAAHASDYLCKYCLVAVQHAVSLACEDMVVSLALTLLVLNAGYSCQAASQMLCLLLHTAASCM